MPIYLYSFLIELNDRLFSSPNSVSDTEGDLFQQEPIVSLVRKIQCQLNILYHLFNFMWKMVFQIPFQQRVSRLRLCGLDFPLDNMCECIYGLEGLEYIWNAEKIVWMKLCGDWQAT